MSKDCHFTYALELDKSTLKQGDILEKTPELLSVIQEVHPHYAKDEYTHFQVLTQSCDLYLRNGKSSSKYITLAAIRRLDTVIERAIVKDIDKNKRIALNDKLYCTDKAKDKLRSFLESLVNNNDKNHFFLQAWPDRGLSTDSCTFLHLSIAVRSIDHYQTCLSSKIIELDDTFKAKLGWMVGNLYSRVGTDDYCPTCIKDRKEFLGYLTNTLDKYIGWVPSNIYPEFRKSFEQSTDKNPDDLIKDAENKIQERRKSKLVQFVGIINSAVEIDEEQKKRLTNLLNSSHAKRFLNLD